MFDISGISVGAVMGRKVVGSGVSDLLDKQLGTTKFTWNGDRLASKFHTFLKRSFDGQQVSETRIYSNI